MEGIASATTAGTPARNARKGPTWRGMIMRGLWGYCQRVGQEFGLFGAARDLGCPDPASPLRTVPDNGASPHEHLVHAVAITVPADPEHCPAVRRPHPCSANGRSWASIRRT